MDNSDNHTMSMESLDSILRRIAAPGTSMPTDGDSDLFPGKPRKDEESSKATNSCLICGGIGWLTHRLPVEHPDFGRAFPCDCQFSDADQPARLAALARFSNLGALRHCTLEAANPQGPENFPGTQQAYAAALSAATRFAEHPAGWITFAGPSASGKTYLAAAIANRQIELGNVAYFITAADLLDYLRSQFDDDDESNFVDRFELVRNVDLLVLDDLPTQAPTTWGQERLFQLLAYRHSARLPTVVTLRGDPARLDEFLRTRLDSPDGFTQLHALGRIGGGSRVLGAIPPEMLRRMTFDNFDPRGNSQLTPDQIRSLTYTKNVVDHWSVDPHAWLFLVGPIGVGKTHLAVAAAAERERRGDEIFFATVPDLLDYLRATFAPDSIVAYDDLLDRIKTVDLLVLDDMGAERSTPFAEDKLFQIINYRYESRLATIITSSHVHDDIATFRPRIASRLSDRSVVMELPIEVPDYRGGKLQTDSQ